MPMILTFWSHILYIFVRLEALISLGLSRDEATQEYATEAIAEMLTVPAIQVSMLQNL